MFQRRPRFPAIPRTILILALWVIAGCGDSPPPPSNPTQAQPFLVRVLEAWKRGETPESLAAADPPIRVRDHEWQSGWKLDAYELKGDARPLGVNVQQFVALNLKDPRGKSLEKDAVYQVNTGATPVVTRDDPDN